MSQWPEGANDVKTKPQPQTPEPPSSRWPKGKGTSGDDNVTSGGK
ncbi:hypothetical protein [Microbispora sp. CA-102843]